MQQWQLANQSRPALAARAALQTLCSPQSAMLETELGSSSSLGSSRTVSNQGSSSTIKGNQQGSIQALGGNMGGSKQRSVSVQLLQSIVGREQDLQQLQQLDLSLEQLSSTAGVDQLCPSLKVGLCLGFRVTV